MSTFLSQARARALRPTRALSRPRLTIVPKAAARAPKVGFVLLVVTVLAVGLVGLLLLNTSLQRGAYVDEALRARSSALDQRQQDLELSVAALQEPQRVAHRAERLGMVRNDSPAFLVLGTGKVIGVATPGAAGNVVDIGSAAAGSVGKRLKVVEPVSGSHNTITSGAIVVPGLHTGQGRGSTNARDTRTASPGPSTARGTNNSGTSGHHQPH